MANPDPTLRSAMPGGIGQPPPVADGQQLLQALTTEHFTLQAARSATIMETNGRSALFLSTVASAVVALAFIGQVADVGQPFFLFALAVLPALFFVGLLTSLRLVQSAIEDLLYARAINRIRRYYLELDPSASRWFLLGGHDDLDGVMANQGLTPTGRHLLSHTARMVAVVTSIVAGVFVALVVGAVGAPSVPVEVAAAVGVLVSVAVTAALWRHQARQWRAAERRVPASFPSASEPASRIQATPASPTTLVAADATLPSHAG
jgi:hypothetical protein